MQEGLNKARVINGSTIQITAEIQVTPHDLAHWFCNMSDTEQAEFFDACGVISDAWTRPGCFQWHLIGEHTTRSGSRVMQDIADGLENRK